MRSHTLAGLVLLAIVAQGCSSSSEAPKPAPTPCSTEAECSSKASTPLCDSATHVCVALPKGHEIGYRDGSTASVDLTVVHTVGKYMKPVDLEFHSERTDELWIDGYGDNSVEIGFGVGGDGPSWKNIYDRAAPHFMDKPPALAMGTPDRWATCGDNDNSQNEHAHGDGGGVNFMGPALFSTDLSIMGEDTPGGLGSHEDMLHSTPFCRGIAHVEANIYWVFNSYDKSLDKYDFHIDHGPGNNDHSDGEIFRYAAGQVQGADDGTSSHVFFDAKEGVLYAADTGHQRIVRFDPRNATRGDPLPRQNEPLKDNAVMNGGTLKEIVGPGTLEKPSGLEVRDGLLYVTDAATSRFVVFDKEGHELRHLDTGLPPGSLSGFTFHADGTIYFTDKVAGRILRIDPK